MAALWTMNPDGVWVPAQIYPHDTNGWKSAKKVYEKTSTTVWSQRWSADQTPPAAPTITYTTNAQAKTYQLTLKMPADADVSRMILKYSTTGFPKVPSSAPETGAYYSVRAQDDGTLWSTRVVTPSLSFTRDGTGAIPGAIYYFSCWVQDTSGNWSAAGTASFKMPVYTAPATTTINKSLTLNCTDSGTWMFGQNYWRSDNQYVQTGGSTRQGLWFYGGKLSAALQNAKKITKFTIRIQRVNSVHGVTGEANVNLAAHTLNYQNISPEGKETGGTVIGTLSRGEVGTFDVPSGWWPNFISGAWKGLGLYYNGSDQSYSSPQYIHTYGAGTTSGQIHVEWQE